MRPSTLYVNYGKDLSHVGKNYSLALTRGIVPVFLSSLKREIFKVATLLE